MANQEIIDLQDSIIAELTEKYTDFTVQDYEDIDDTIATPAILVNLVGFEGNSDLSENLRTVLTLNFEAYVCYSFSAQNAKRAISQFSASLSNFINNNTFSDSAFPALIKSASPFVVDIDGLEVWVIEWEQDLEITGDGTS